MITMKKTVLALFCACSVSAFSQIKPSVIYDGGELLFVPAQLTSKGIPFMYSHNKSNHSTYITIFDEDVNIVEQSEIKAEILNYTTRTITTQRKFFMPYKDGGTRSSSEEEGYFLDEWTLTDDVTEEKVYHNEWIVGPEVYEDNNNYHSRYMYLSQTLFNQDDDFEFLRDHYEVMPLSYCADDDRSGDHVGIEKPNFGDEDYDYYTQDFDYELGGFVFTLVKTKVYGGVKHTGIDIVSLDGTIKQTLEGITSLQTVVSINGNFYVSAYDWTTQTHGLYKIASTATAIERVAETSPITTNNTAYTLDGFKATSNTKGVIIKNGQKILNK